MAGRLTLAAGAVCAPSAAAAAQPELGVTVGRATDSQGTDVVRLTYRRPLAGAPAAVTQPWWRPQFIQFGASLWRVPDLEGGIGAYLLTHTINNDDDRLPSALQFGSHIGVGLRLGAGQASVSLGLQHLSNAGLKRPNGGINFYLLALSVPL